MNSALRHSLEINETDVEGALHRFAGDEALYVSCLEAFLSDNTMDMLDEAIFSQSWDDAFTAAHALKGLAGNMGFIPLFHTTGELVLQIRTGRMNDIIASNRNVRRCYDAISNTIRREIHTEAPQA